MWRAVGKSISPAKRERKQIVSLIVHRGLRHLSLVPIRLDSCNCYNGCDGSARDLSGLGSDCFRMQMNRAVGKCRGTGPEQEEQGLA